MSSEGISKKRSRTSSNDGDDDDDASLYHQKSKRTPSAYIPAVSTASVVVSNRTPGDTVADDGRFRHALASSASGAQPTPSLSASKPVPYVWPRQKRDQVISLNCTPMRDGDTWYLISRTWYEKWQAACNPALRAHRREADDRLGPVDNSDIVGANGELIPGLSEGSSVCCVSQRVMELFTQWYGFPKYPIARKVISEGNYSTKRIEFYPYKIKTYWMSKMKRHLPSSQPTHAIHISRTAPVSELLARVSEKWGNVTPARFWHAQVNSLEQDPVSGIFYSSSRIRNDSTQPFATTEVEKTKRLDEVGLEDGDAIIMETMHGEEWTIDLEMTTLGRRINRPKAQEPQVAVLIKEYLAKCRSDLTIKPDFSGLYSFSQSRPGHTTTNRTTPPLGERINQPKAQESKAVVFSEEQIATYRNHRAGSVTGIGAGGGMSLAQPCPSTTIGPLGTIPPFAYPNPSVITGTRGVPGVPGTPGVGAGFGGPGGIPMIHNMSLTGNQAAARAMPSIQQMQGANKPGVTQFEFPAMTPGYPQPSPAMLAGQPPQSRLGQLGVPQQQPGQLHMHGGAPTNPFHTLKPPIIPAPKAPSSTKPAHYPVPIPSGPGAASGSGIVSAKKEGTTSQPQRQSQFQATVNQSPLPLGTGAGAIAGGVSYSFSSTSSGGPSSNPGATAKPSAGLPSAGLEFDFSQMLDMSDLFINGLDFSGLEFMNSGGLGTGLGGGADDTFMFLNMPDSMDGDNLLG